MIPVLGISAFIPVALTQLTRLQKNHDLLCYLHEKLVEYFATEQSSASKSTIWSKKTVGRGGALRRHGTIARQPVVAMNATR